MTDDTQPEALRLAEILEGDYCPDWFYEQGVDEVAAELRRQHTRIAELESELEAVGAGGVQALSAAPAEVMKWPKDASEVREFMHTHCITEQYAVGIESPSDDDKYLLSAHDFLSAVNWWADFPHYQKASPTPPAEQQAMESVLVDGAASQPPISNTLWRMLTGGYEHTYILQLPNDSRDRRELIDRACHNWRRICAEIGNSAVASAVSPQTAQAPQQAAPKAASTRTALPEGWTACTIEFCNDGPEEVAYGPKRMMARLAKWLGKYFAQVIAEARTTARATADSVTAPAGPSKSLPYEPTSAMLIAARERDPALPIETVRAIYWSMWRTAPTPPAQAADSVLEDAARLDWLALAGPTSICLVIDRPHDGEVEVATDDVIGYGKTLREAIDAAMKKGGAA